MAVAAEEREVDEAGVERGHRGAVAEEARVKTDFGMRGVVTAFPILHECGKKRVTPEA